MKCMQQGTVKKRLTMLAGCGKNGSFYGNLTRNIERSEPQSQVTLRSPKACKRALHPRAKYIATGLFVLRIVGCLRQWQTAETIKPSTDSEVESAKWALSHMLSVLQKTCQPVSRL